MRSCAPACRRTLVSVAMPMSWLKRVLNVIIVCFVLEGFHAYAEILG